MKILVYNSEGVTKIPGTKLGPKTVAQKFYKKFDFFKLNNISSVKDFAKYEDNIVILGTDHSITADVILNLTANLDVLVIFDAHIDKEINNTKINANWNFINKIEHLFSDIIIIGNRTHIDGMKASDKTLIISAIELLSITEIQEKLLHVIKDKKIYISIDLDVLDPIIMPGVSNPVIGGIDLRELLCMYSFFFDFGCIKATDIVEFNPVKESEKSLSVIEMIMLHIEYKFDIYNKYK